MRSMRLRKRWSKTRTGGACWAAHARGAGTVGLNGWWTGDAVAYALELTEPKVLFGDRRRLERLDGVAVPEGLPIVSFEDDFAAQNRNRPGSSDTRVNEFHSMATGSAPSIAVMLATPVT